jgi:hypothetical protein
MYSWCTLAGNVLNHTYPLEYQSAPASPGRSRVGPALYVFNLLELYSLSNMYSIVCVSSSTKVQSAHE